MRDRRRSSVAADRAALLVAVTETMQRFARANPSRVAPGPSSQGPAVPGRGGASRSVAPDTRKRSGRQP
jgi:hypothetical protein